MIRTSATGRDGRKVYSQTIDVRGGDNHYPQTLEIDNNITARKGTPSEVRAKGYTCVECTYFYPNGKRVPSEIVDAALKILNPETDPIILERRKRQAEEEPINTSL